MTTAPQTRIQKKNRETILEAALEVFSQNGFRGSTLDQIAEGAGLSKPNLLYYFASKDAIHSALMDRLLKVWLDPLRALNPLGDPIGEILGYIQRKAQLSRDYPRESRLFANEILQGAPRMQQAFISDLKPLVDAKAHVIADWMAAGKLAPLPPHHLIFSIWATTQHYADFDVQVRAVLAEEPFPQAEDFLLTLFRRALTPAE